MKTQNTPSRAFRQLNTYVKHYTGKDLDSKKIYCARIGGKRGYQYGDEYAPFPMADRRYTKALDNLRKARCSGMGLVLQYEDIKYVDPEEMQDSIRLEIEWEGVLEHTVRFTVFNSKGKAKSIIML